MHNSLIRTLAGTAAALACAAVCSANVNLSLAPVNATYRAGDTVSIDLVATADSGVQSIGALDVIMVWDPAYLNPISSSDARTKDSRGTYAWFLSGFINGSTLNGNLGDGSAVWTGLGQFLNPFLASTQGNVLTTFKFVAKRACHVGHPTLLSIPHTLGNDKTVVYSGDGPNQDITGTLTGMSLFIFPRKIGPHA